MNDKDHEKKRFPERGELPLSREAKLANALRYLGDNWLLAKPQAPKSWYAPSIRSLTEKSNNAKELSRG